MVQEEPAYAFFLHRFGLLSISLQEDVLAEVSLDRWGALEYPVKIPPGRTWEFVTFAESTFSSLLDGLDASTWPGWQASYSARAFGEDRLVVDTPLNALAGAFEAEIFRVLLLPSDLSTFRALTSDLTILTTSIVEGRSYEQGVGPPARTPLPAARSEAVRWFAEEAEMTLSTLAHSKGFGQSVRIACERLRVLESLLAEVETMDRLKTLGLAVAAYRANREAWPEDLTDLVPSFLCEIPSDGSGNPYGGRRVGDGYIVYEYGPNGTDNGGTPADSRFEPLDTEEADRCFCLGDAYQRFRRTDLRGGEESDSDR
jgi:hypothetical protein